MLNSSQVVNSHKVRHSKEKSNYKRTGDSEGVGDHTKQVREQNSEEKIKQHNEVLLLADVKGFFNDRAHKLIQCAQCEIVVTHDFSAKTSESATRNNDVKKQKKR